MAVADCAKVDNIEWIRRQMGPDSRILLFAHRDHLAGSRSTIRLPGHFEAWTLPPMAGEYLKRRYGSDLVTIAHFFSREAIRPGEPAIDAAPGTIEARLASLGLPHLLLDLRSAPPPVAAWLATRHELFGVTPWNTTVLGETHDAVYFSNS
ncbi:MAG: erythromycin esterase family protein [Dongiaceae bacterium]